MAYQVGTVLHFEVGSMAELVSLLDMDVQWKELVLQVPVVVVWAD